MKSISHATRKILLWITLLEMLIITPIASTVSSPETITKVEPYSSTANKGEIFAINITVTNVQNLFGLEVTLYWNPSILQMININVWLGVESYSHGVLHEPVSIAINETIQEEGKYQLAGMSTGRETPSFNGSGTIVRITFNVTSIGSCDLNLETKLANKPQPGGIASPIAHTTVDGFFSSTEPQQPPWPYTTIATVIVLVVMVTASIVVYQKRIKKAKLKP